MQFKVLVIRTTIDLCLEICFRKQKYLFEIPQNRYKTPLTAVCLVCHATLLQTGVL